MARRGRSPAARYSDNGKIKFSPKDTWRVELAAAMTAGVGRFHGLNLDFAERLQTDQPRPERGFASSFEMAISAAFKP